MPSILFDNNEMCEKFGNSSLQISKDFNLNVLKEKFYQIIKNEMFNLKEENK